MPPSQILVGQSEPTFFVKLIVVLVVISIDERLELLGFLNQGLSVVVFLDTLILIIISQQNTLHSLLLKNWLELGLNHP